MTSTASQIDSAATHRRPVALAGLVGGLYFLLACCLIPDYGPTWDVVQGDYPYGDEVVAWWLSDTADFVTVAERDEPIEVRQPYPAFHGKQFDWYMVYPVAATLSAIASRLLWHELGWVPPIAAHQIVIPLLTALLVAVMVMFLGRAVGVAAAALMIASPRFLSHSISNLKDIPECVFYSLALYAAYRALRDRRSLDWIVAGVMTALALAQKANALFLPIHVLTFFVLAKLTRTDGLRIRWSGVALGAAAFTLVYFAVSPAFWHDPWTRIALHFGEIANVSGMDVLNSVSPLPDSQMERFSAPLNAAITTPLPVLVLAIFGAAFGAAPRVLRLFLIVQALFPIGRLLLPGVRDFDGVRHFLEFYPGLCGLAGLGGIWVLSTIRRIAARQSPGVGGWVSHVLVVLGVAVCLAPGIQAVIRTHPHGTCYFNALIGGLRGAQLRGVPQATDYWAGSYWQGMAWLRDHASPDADLHVPIASHVAVAIAPIRLRPDIRVEPAEFGAGDLYVMFVTRRERYGRVARYLTSTGHAAPAMRIQVQGAPILLIYRISDDAEKAEIARLRHADDRLQVIRIAFLNWLEKNARNRFELRGVLNTEIADGRVAAVAALCSVLPVLSPDDAEQLLEWIAVRER